MLSNRFVFRIVSLLKRRGEGGGKKRKKKSEKRNDNNRREKVSSPISLSRGIGIGKVFEPMRRNVVHAERKERGKRVEKIESKLE